MADPKIRVSVDSSTLRNEIDSIRSSANQLADDMIRASRSASTSSREIKKDMESQIRAMERSVQSEYQTSLQGLRGQRQKGVINAAEFRTRYQGLQQQTGTDKLQIQFLKDINESIWATSREEIRQDRAGVEKKIREDKRVESLNIGSQNPREALMRTIQRDILGKRSRREKEERDLFRGGSPNRALTTVAGSRNEFFLAAAALALIPTVGAGLQTAATRLLGGAQGYESILGRHAGLRNMTLRGVRGELTGREEEVRFGGRKAGGKLGSVERMYLDFSKEIGMTISQQMTSQLAYSKAFGGAVSVHQFQNLISASRRFDLAEGDLQNILGISRRDLGATGGATGADKILSMFKQFFTDTGKQNYEMRNYLTAYTETANQILTNVSGQIDQGQIAASIISMGRATGFNDLDLRRLAGGIQGMGMGKDAITQARMLTYFSRAMPGKSLFEVEAAMENPLSNPAILKNMFTGLQGQYGLGSEMLMREFKRMTGLSATQTLNLFQPLGPGGKRGPMRSLSGVFNEFEKNIEKYRGTETVNFAANINEITGTLTKATAKTNSLLEKYGADLVDVMSDTYKGIGELVIQVQETRKEQMRIGQKLIDNGNEIIGSLVYIGATNPVGTFQ